MILGIGADICDIRRIERLLKRFGGRFTARIFTAAECEKARRRADPEAVFALSYAAKEACSKALGTGFRHGVHWRHIGVGNNELGKPFLTLSGGAGKRLEEMVPDGMTGQIDLSLSDEYPMAQAMVIISARINGPAVP